MFAFLKKTWQELLTAIHWPTYEEIAGLGISFVVTFSVLLISSFFQQYLAKAILHNMFVAALH